MPKTLVQQIDLAVDALRAGSLIAYPTEAVFGIGCDPDNEQALVSVLTVKQRTAEKGLICIAASIEQLQPIIDFSQLPAPQLKQVQASWPGAVTWLMPVKRAHVSPLLTGAHDTLAVRVTSHPVAQQLCRAFGKPIVSTSANIASEPPGRNAAEVGAIFGEAIAVIIDAKCGGNQNPSQIIDALSGKIIRA